MKGRREERGGNGKEKCRVKRRKVSDKEKVKIERVCKQ